MKVIFSTKKEHDVFKNVIKKLRNIKNLECIFHDPVKEFFKLDEIPKFLKDIDYFKWIKKIDKPILGICGGMHILGLVFNGDLKKEQEIGLTDIKINEEKK